MRQAVIVEAVRTPLGKRGGALKDWHPTDLLAATLAELVERAKVDPGVVDDVITGCVTQVGEQSINIGRYAWLAAGLPEEVPATTIDRQCGSSQQAAHFAAQGVISGAYDVAIACGIEHMTRVPMGTNMYSGTPFSPALLARYDTVVPQGISSELVAADFDISREELDEFAASSHERAAAATDEGRFKREILPLKVQTETGAEVFESDEGIRRNPDRQKMSQLNPAFFDPSMQERFPEIRWSTTAANSSQITDGAAALLIVEASLAERLGLNARARFSSFALAGADPIRMLTAPIPATRKALTGAGLELDSIDVVEINEAFSSVPLAWKKALDIDDDWFEERVNRNGGAIALGHPLGASGARLMTTLLHELERSGGRYGLQTMCEGGGLSNATIIERI